MKRSMMSRLCVMILGVFLGFLPTAALADMPTPLSVAPSAIDIGAGYNGLALAVSGKVPEGSDVVLRFTGPPGELHMREKGKVFGLLWMNVRSVAFKNVPKVCLVQSSKPLDQLGPAAEPLGLENLRQTVEMETSGSQTETLDGPAELLRLKKREGLCSESSGDITFGAPSDGMQSFSAAIRVPSALAPGHYQVQAIALKDGVEADRASADITATLVGIPAWLNTMAFKHGTLYGILAAVIAILAGLLIGMVFQSKGAH
jgi:uncharacterized protein (TIGR02186 family)